MAVEFQFVFFLKLMFKDFFLAKDLELPQKSQGL